MSLKTGCNTFHWFGRPFFTLLSPHTRYVRTGASNNSKAAHFTSLTDGVAERWNGQPWIHFSPAAARTRVSFGGPSSTTLNTITRSRQMTAGSGTTFIFRTQNWGFCHIKTCLAFQESAETHKTNIVFNIVEPRADYSEFQPSETLLLKRLMCSRSAQSANGSGSDTHRAGCHTNRSI